MPNWNETKRKENCIKKSSINLQTKYEMFMTHKFICEAKRRRKKGAKHIVVYPICFSLFFFAFSSLHFVRLAFRLIYICFIAYYNLLCKWRACFLSSIVTAYIYLTDEKWIKKYIKYILILHCFKPKGFRYFSFYFISKPRHCQSEWTRIAKRWEKNWKRKVFLFCLSAFMRNRWICKQHAIWKAKTKLSRKETYSIFYFLFFFR